VYHLLWRLGRPREGLAFLIVFDALLKSFASFCNSEADGW